MQVGERGGAIQVEFILASTEIASAPTLDCADAGEAMFNDDALA